MIKKYKKKGLFMIMLLNLSILFAGCAAKSPYIKNRLSYYDKSGQKGIAFMEETFLPMVMAGDKDGIMELFSDTAKEQIPDLEDSIERMCNEVRGESIVDLDISNYHGGGGTSYPDNNGYWFNYYSADFSTEEESYSIDIHTMEFREADAKQLGFTRIIFETEETKAHYIEIYDYYDKKYGEEYGGMRNRQTLARTYGFSYFPPEEPEYGILFTADYLEEVFPDWDYQTGE